MKKFLIKSGCRNSKLSLVQTQNALNAIATDLPNIEFQIIGLMALGDKDKNLPLDAPTTPDDIWTRELDEKILNNELDIAVHSAKDLPPKIKDEIDFFWLPWSEEPGDVLIFRQGQTTKDLPAAPIAAVSSDRRSIYVKMHYPNAVLKPIRGTIEERIAQLDKGDYDILLMAEAALNRLGLQARISVKIPLSELPPPEGQGKIAITFRKNNPLALLIRNLYIHPVCFVGAGPGDPELLTIKGKKALEKADCILYDALANPAILEYASPNAEKIYVGKRSGEHSLTQSEITKLIVTKVKQGKSIVRLKGGDPAIFGRLSEELSELQLEGVPYRIIPGISALNGVTTAAGVLLTARGVNQSFLTATATTETLEKDYLNQYASQKQPVVFFMGLKQLPQIVSSFTQHGWDTKTPIAIISENYGSKIIRGNLGNIESKMKSEANLSPALITIGDFASDKNDKRSPLPILKDCRVLLPGVKESVIHLAETVEEKGGIAISWPLVQLESNKDFLSAIQDLSKYDLIVLPSPASVRFLFDFVIQNQLSFAKGVEFAVTGPGTANELKKFGQFPKYCPDNDFSSEGLIQKFKQFNLSSKNVLLPHSDIGGKEIENHLAKTSFVTSAVLYFNSTINPQKPLPEFDAILFTSPSGINSFSKLYGNEILNNKIIGVIGKVTKQKALQIGLRTDFIANQSTTEGLVHSLVAFIQNRKFETN